MTCFGDQITNKNTKTYTKWLKSLSRVLNMPIELKSQNYYSKVFKKINYKLSNSTFWVVITPPNRHIASPLAIKEKNENKKQPILKFTTSCWSKTILKWHDDLIISWNIKEIQAQISTRVITNYAKHCQSRECIMQTEVLKSFPLSKNQTLIFHKNLCVLVP